MGAWIGTGAGPAASYLAARRSFRRRDAGPHWEQAASLGAQDHSVNKTEAAGPGRASLDGGRRRVPRWLVWGCGVVLVLLLIAGVAVAYVVHNAEPILRRKVIATLEQRFHSRVDLDALHISLWRGIRVEGDGLRIFSFGEKESAAAGNQAPMLSVRDFRFRAGLMELFEPTMRVREVDVEGMQLHIPPKPERAPLLPKQTPDESGKKLSIVVGRVVCSDITLTIETDKPGKLPLVFLIRDVTLHDAGPGKAFPFEATLVNAKPVGDIHARGQIGPWQGDDPRETPVDGSYSFTHADLGTIKGISGTLSSTGKFSGTLGEIGVTGTTATPNFALDVSGHPMDLETQFDATVDGLTGDTLLHRVHATLGHTVLEVKGMVVRAAGPYGAEAAGRAFGGSPSSAPGHIIEIAVTSDHARIEDLLWLAVKTEPPLMRGPMTLQAKLRIPPGHVSVTEKMQVEGTFTIHDASFSNPRWQETVDKLSERASGNPEQANAQQAKPVASDMSGAFSLAGGALHVSKLNYRMPGATVDLAGKYGLDGKTFDFDGTVRTKATMSQMLTGWKSILAMPFDPLLKKDGAGVQVPIKIDGTRSDPKIGLDLGKLGSQIVSGHKQPQPQNAPKP